MRLALPRVNKESLPLRHFCFYVAAIHVYESAVSCFDHSQNKSSCNNSRLFHCKQKRLIQNVKCYDALGATSSTLTSLLKSDQ